MYIVIGPEGLFDDFEKPSISDFAFIIFSSYIPRTLRMSVIALGEDALGFIQAVHWNCYRAPRTSGTC